MVRKMAFGNLKGGVGKTSVVLGLADALAQQGKRVVVCDLDPQGSATNALGVDVDTETLTTYDVLAANEQGCLDDAIIDSAWEGIAVVPADSQLASLATETMMAGEHRLQTAALGAERFADYDVALFDLPPSLGRLTLNGLLAADEAVGVTIPEAMSVDRLREFLDTITGVQTPFLNPDLRLRGIITNAVDTRLGEHRFQSEQMAELWGEFLLSPSVPLRSAVKDMASTQQPIRLTGNRSAKAVAEIFDELATTLIGGSK